MWPRFLHVAIRPFLEDGEKVLDSFQALRSPGCVLLAGFPPPVNRLLIVARTDRNLVVFDTKVLQWSVPTGIRVRLPRTTKVGPTRGVVWLRVYGLERHLGGRVYVHRKYRSSVLLDR